MAVPPMPPVLPSSEKHALSTAAPPAKRVRVTHSRSPNPLQVKPLGNLLFRPSNRFTRISGLGTLAALPDELLLSHVFGQLEGEDLVRAAGVSRAFFGWGHVEGIWKGVYISKTQGRLLDWHGSWRSSYIATFLRPREIPFATPLPTSGITTPTHHSDVLFQPALCASFDPLPIFLAPSFVPSIPHVSGLGLTPDALPLTPVILTDLMSSWAAMAKTARRWTLDDLAARFTDIGFRAEATITTLPRYREYHERCELDESPLYLFESDFVEKTAGRSQPGLGDDYQVPECFTEDLFEVMGPQRPDYRWLIVGPTRSGSTWHQDPNGTSAWNAVTVGSKAWIMFSPDVTPPGVFVSADQGEVEAPLSLAEWFATYYKGAKAMYGARAKDASKRGKMIEGICNAGEIFFVPSGWWHIVINLAPSIAVTQNFVSHRELPTVLRFMRDRPEQVSGFKLHRPEAGGADVASGLDECDECVTGVFEAFRDALRTEKADLGDLDGLLGPSEPQSEAPSERVGGVWEKVKAGEDSESAEGGGGFSFGFGGDVELDDFEDVV